MAPQPNAAANEGVIRDVLKMQFGRDVLDISLHPGSNNTKIYIVSLAPATGGGADSKEQDRPPGTQALPLSVTKAIMRIPDPGANLNSAVRVENEVAATALAREALKPLNKQLVPDIYGWGSAAAGETGWVLMEFMPGTPLSAAEFKKLDSKPKKAVLDQMAEILNLLQQYEFPASVEGYGGLGFAEDGSITVGPTPIHGATRRCKTYHELYTEYLHTQLRFMDECDVVKGWKDTDLRARIDDFVSKGFKPLIEQAFEAKPRPTLVHGDFDLHNLLFDPATKSLTALLDWEFSHIASTADEYFYSFSTIGGMVEPPIEDGPPHDGMSRRRRGLLYGYDGVERRDGDEADWDIVLWCDEAFARAGARRPIDLMPDIEPLSNLYWFIQNISPGAFFLPRFRAKHSADKIAQMRAHFQESVGQMLSGWGF